MPAEEVCVAKDIDTSGDTGNVKSENTAVALILIVGGCIVVIGGLYAYFSIADKKYKAKLEENSKKNTPAKKKDKKDKSKDGKKDKDNKKNDKDKKKIINLQKRTRNKSG